MLEASAVMVWVLDCQMRAQRFKSPTPGQKFGSRYRLHLRSLKKSAMMSTLTIHCQLQDEMVRERAGHLPSYAESKKMKSLTLHTEGRLWCSLRGCSFSSHFLLTSSLDLAFPFVWFASIVSPT